MPPRRTGQRAGVGKALAAAALFGLSTPLAKALLANVAPRFWPASSIWAHLRRRSGERDEQREQRPDGHDLRTIAASGALGRSSQVVCTSTAMSARIRKIMEPRMATAARGGTGAAAVAGAEAAESADTMGTGSGG
ncbi:MAG: hypothetical protein H0T68_01550 [Gemmatimonadales bacterium]|nr:hypothetical protein [Gemmatimonadales bacterium]MBA3555877.1 hypothetical protein [Gemmatimonadales bacterium]